MKFFKICLLFSLLILSTGLISIKKDNMPLSQEELEYIFPDDNFRRVVTNYFPNENITLSKLKNLKGEFYASNEQIKDLKGISTLENIDSFVFWNNNIDSIPPEIKKLNKIKYINIANNYLTDDSIIKTLINKGVEVSYDLNFINDEKYQYELRTKTTNLYLDENEEVDLRSLLYKTIDNYDKYWEVSNVISSDCNLYIESSNPSALSTNSKKGTCRAGNKKGLYYIVISLSKNKFNTSSAIIKTTIK